MRLKSKIIKTNRKIDWAQLFILSTIIKDKSLFETILCTMKK